MAISLVGTGKAAAVLNGGNVTLTFDVGTVQEGDIVIAWGGGFNRAGAGYPGPVTAGYTTLVTDTASLPYRWLGYKVQGPTPDTNFVGQGNGNANDAIAYGAYVLRGVAAAVLDVAVASAGPTASTNPDAPALGSATATAGAWILALAISTSNDSAPGTVSGYANLIQAGGNDTNDASVAGATLGPVGAGTLANPPAWSAWTTGTWKAWTLAIKAATAAAQSVTGGNRASTLTLNAPSAAYRIAAAAVVSSLALFSPTVRQNVVGVHRPSTVVLTAPSNVGGIGVAGAHRPSTATLSAPGTRYQVAGPTRAAGAVLNAPTVRYRVVGGTRPASSVLTAPTVAHRVAGAHRASTLVLSAPTLRQRVTGAFKASSAVLSTPTVTRGPVAVTGAHRSSTLALHAPVVSQGAQFVQTAHRASMASLSAPTLRARLAAPTLAPGAVLHAPAVVPELAIAAGHVASTTQVRAPSLPNLGGPVAEAPDSIVGSRWAAVTCGALAAVSTGVVRGTAITGAGWDPVGGEP